MIQLLSYAEGPDPEDSSLRVVVIALAIIGVIGLLAAIPAAVARRRLHRHREGIVAALLLWAVLSAGSAIFAVNAQTTYAREYNRRIMSGYFDPRDTADAPELPWALWIALMAAYAGVMVWIWSGAPFTPQGSDPTAADR
ncbi:MAG TPA: hypothetical protein VG326_11235 [Tepidisphaeraceae bacterium]|jgi:hypothetical protein|nr:hypothetical protein [Tepidisphaeraceae bacterium]